MTSRGMRRGWGAVLAAVALAGCATSGSSAGAPGTTAGAPDAATGGGSTVAPSSSSTTTTTPPAFEVFTGGDEAFYVPPSPLPPGEPGTLIRVRAVATKDGTATVKVMYHSTDAAGRDRAVSALVTYPTTAAPAAGWPVVATAPGTVGIAAKCGITRRIDEAPAWGVEGVRVITDYIGLGVEGGPPHPYLSKLSEGHSVLDAVRAVRHLPDAHAGTRWLSVGHSQGGHGALSAHELSATYAPDLDLVGTLALAPAAMLDRVYGGIDPVVTVILTVMSTYGAAGERPTVHPEDFVSPELAAVAGVLETGCLDEITDALVPLALEGKLFTTDPRTVEPTRSMLVENEVGDTKVTAPLFLVSGTKDDRVVIERVRDLYERLCRTGQVTELLIIEGADHGSILPQTADRTASWLNDRLAGRPPIDSCITAPPP